MRRLAILFALFGWCASFPPFPTFGVILAEWNFNSTFNDGDISTGNVLPSRGDGTLTLVEGLNSVLGSVAGGKTSDPALSDNSQMRITRLPPIDEENKGAAIEFTLPTMGYENLILAWDQYNSATASRYWRVQYTRDGFAWIDHAVVANTNASAWNRFRVSFDALPVNNRPYLGIRIAPEFENTATGSGEGRYAAVKEGSTYSAAGSWWLDMISISGRQIGTTNSLPNVTPMADLILEESSESGAIEFTIFDSETAPDALLIFASSSHTNVAAGFSLNGADTNRSVSFRGGAPGEAWVTIRVTDEEGESAETTFKVTVLPKGTDTEEPVENFFLLWDFNSLASDADPATGTLLPALGTGGLRIAGTENHSFGSVGQSRTSDPEEADNSMLRLGSFPAQGNGNQSAGVELKASTAGLRNIRLVWDQYNSATASRFWRVQYTTNGTDFIDHALTTNSTPSTWLRQRKVSFENVAGVSDNPFFGIRLVSEWGMDGTYRAAGETSNYSTAGTLWLDMLGIAGERITAAPPAIRVRFDGQLRISWPLIARDFALETKTELASAWAAAEGERTETGAEVEVIIPAGERWQLFRLRQMPAP